MLRRRERTERKVGAALPLCLYLRILTHTLQGTPPNSSSLLAYLSQPIMLTTPCTTFHYPPHPPDPTLPLLIPSTPATSPPTPPHSSPPTAKKQKEEIRTLESQLLEARRREMDTSLLLSRQIAVLEEKLGNSLHLRLNVSGLRLTSYYCCCAERRG